MSQERFHHTQTALAFAVKTTSSAALPTSKRLHFDRVRRRIPCVRYKVTYVTRRRIEK